MIKPISREEEARLPAFKGAEEAYRYFREVYGDRFAFQKIETIGDGERYWLCHLIIDRDVYLQGMRGLAGKSALMVDGMRFLQSYQVFELMESGSIHIVH